MQTTFASGTIVGCNENIDLAGSPFSGWPTENLYELVKVPIVFELTICSRLKKICGREPCTFSSQVTLLVHQFSFRVAAGPVLLEPAAALVIWGC